MRDHDVGAVPDMVETFGALHQLLLTTQSLEALLTDIAVLAAGVVQPPASCGITMRCNNQPLTVANSDWRASLVDETQYSAGEGPCLDALDTGTVVSVSDQRQETRWPSYGDHALEQGVRCSLSLPLIVAGQPVGALNLYGYAESGCFEGESRARAEVFSAQASTALTLLTRQSEQAKLTSQLEEALASRSVIDQAMGIVMGQQKCTAVVAFNLLRKHSQNNNHKLRDVAADLVARTTGYEPSSPPEFIRQRRPEYLSPG